jgi:hypothetical protein
MGTRALTTVLDKDGEPLVTLYHHFDGYPSGVGKEIFDAVGRIKLADGLGPDRKALGEWANGMGDVAAQLISLLKTHPGDLYLVPPNTMDIGEEYTYTLSCKEKELLLAVFDDTARQELFAGPIKDFPAFLQTQQE